MPKLKFESKYRSCILTFKFPFEHFAWGQVLLYYDRVSTVIKDYILGKAWEAQLAMLVAGKKCWDGSVKKWLLHKSALGGGRFSASGSTTARMMPQLAATCAFQARTAQPPLRTVPRTMHIHPTRLAGVRGWAKSKVLWCNVHNVRVEVQMAKLVTLQLMPPVGAKSMTGGLINQEARAPPPLVFPTQC
jgi:hypothetical protein